MLRWPFRARPGSMEGDDVVFEVRSLFSRLFPNNWNIGWGPYANAAANRNRQEKKLNDLAQKLEKEVLKLIQVQQQLAEDLEDTSKFGFNHQGVGKVFYKPKSYFKDLLPYTDRPPSTWKDWINPMKLRKLEKDFKVKFGQDSKKSLKNPNTRNDVAVWSTNKKAVEDHPEAFGTDGATKVLHYDSKAAKGDSKKGGKVGINDLKGEFPQKEGESKQEYHNRLGKIAQQRNKGG